MANPKGAEMRRKKLVAIAASAAISLATVTGTAVAATPAGRPGADVTPPSSPFIVYAQGFFCYTLYIGATRSTDNVTREPKLRYEVFANDEFIGLLDRGSPTTAWGNLKLTDEGPNLVYVEAVDAAGNRARSNTATVTGFDCEV
jgi:hypothetical protein